MRMMTQVCSNKDKNIMQVIEKDGVHWVEVGAFTAGPFATNAEAWSWIDRHSNEGLGDTERYDRIRMAVNGSYEPGI
jgi:hypothetical protein